MGMAFVANKKATALEEAVKKKEDIKLTKLKRAQEKKDKAIANDLKGLLGTSKKAFKKNWEPSAIKEAGQKLHDTIKENHPINSRIPYCGTQPWQCKHNQKIAFAKLKPKHAWREQHIPMPYFPDPLVLPWFHGV
jgi:hypothetical protein